MRAVPWLSAATLFAALVLAAACVSDDPGACPEALPAAVDDPQVRTYLSDLKAAHERADAALEASDRAAAIRSLEQAIGEVPAGPASREAAADTLVRLAELRLAEGELDQAKAAVERGQAVVEQATVTHGRLLEVLAAIESGREPGGGAAAEDALERAREIQRAVIERARGCAAETPAVDAALVAFLSLAEVTHRLADRAEGARAEAILRELVDGPMPGEPPLAPEAREVLGDTLARLAELESARGAFDAARRDIERGLRLVVERTLYRGRLMEVLGVLEERRHQALSAEGREAEAEEAKQRAIDAFAEAVAIQDEVIRSMLEGEAP